LLVAVEALQRCCVQQRHTLSPCAPSPLPRGCRTLAASPPDCLPGQRGGLALEAWCQGRLASPSLSSLLCYAWIRHLVKLMHATDSGED
jgi:hypothetical protein